MSDDRIRAAISILSKQDSSPLREQGRKLANESSVKNFRNTMKSISRETKPSRTGSNKVDNALDDATNFLVKKHLNSDDEKLGKKSGKGQGEQAENLSPGKTRSAKLGNHASTHERASVQKQKGALARHQGSPEQNQLKSTKREAPAAASDSAKAAGSGIHASKEHDALVAHKEKQHHGEHLDSQGLAYLLQSHQMNMPEGLKAQPVEATAGASPAPSASLDDLGQEIASRILVSSPKSAGDTQVRIQVRNSILPMTEIQISRSAGQLVVAFVSGNKDTENYLSRNLDKIQKSLKSKLAGESVRVLCFPKMMNVRKTKVDLGIGIYL